MDFRDSFIAVTPDCLIDPQLKLRMAASGTKELRNDGTITVAYDPEIAEDRLTMSRPDEDRAALAHNPLLAHLADKPVPFKSARSEFLFNFNVHWNVCDGTLRIYLADSRESLILSEKSISDAKIRMISEFPKDIMLYALRCAANFSAIGHDKFPSQEYPDIRLIEVFASSDVAENFFGISSPDFQRIKSDFVRVASREIAQ